MYVRAQFYFLAGLILAGCTVGPDYKRPSFSVQQTWPREPATQPSMTSPEAPPLAWWRTLDDPTLDWLVERAWHDNFDVSIARSRIRESRALRAISASGLYPHLAASGDYDYYHADGPLFPARTGDYQFWVAGFDAIWEADVFGRVRRSVEAAQDDLEAQRDQARGVLVSLVAEVARNYVELRTAQQREAIAKQNIRTDQQTLELVLRLSRQGLVSDLDVTRARSEVTTAQSQLPLFDVQEKEAIHRLGILLGQSPDALMTELTPSAAIPAPPRLVPIGLPSDVLRRRPDVRQVERQLASATAQIGVAEAELYPQFTLTGDFEFGGTQAADLFKWSDRAYGIGPSVRWEIFEGGRILANVDAHKAVRQELIDQYKLTILTAIGEAEDALVSFKRQQDQYELLRESVEADQTSVRISNERYASGSVNFLTVLDAERTLLQSQDARVVSEGNITLSIISLYKAVGGGWEQIEQESKGAVVAGK